MVISGGSGDDYLNGEEGNDVINAGSGNDTVDGGAGFDVLTVDASTSNGAYALTYTVSPATGAATSLYAGSSFDAIHDALAQSGGVLALNAGSLGSVTFTNIERMNVTGVNTDGNGGRDLLIFQGSGGSYHGGTPSGYDTFYADWSAAASAITWANDPSQTQTVNGVAVSGLERLLLVTGSGDDVISNTNVNTDDTFITGDGNDTVNAGLGSNRVETGAGDDAIASLGGTVDGGTGFDTLTVDASTSNGAYALTYTVSPATGAATSLYAGSSFDAIHDALAQSDAGLTLNAGSLGSVTFTNIERMNVTGVNTDGNGGSGLLIFQGSGGSYHGGTPSGYDTFYADWSAATTAITWANDPSQTQTVNGVTVSGLERLLLLTGSGDDIIRNTHVSTNDYIDAGAGNDILEAGGGNDTLVGGAGNDVFIFSASAAGTATVVDFADGDTLRIQGANLAWSLGGNAGALGLGETLLSVSGGQTTLSVGTNATPGADLTVLLTGEFTASQLRLQGSDITFNHSPVLTAAIPDQTTGDVNDFTFVLPANTFTDPDAGDVLAYSATLCRLGFLALAHAMTLWWD